MFHNAHGCADHTVSIRRNAFLVIFTSIELIFLNFEILKFSSQAFVLHLVSLTKVKACWSVEHNTSKYRLEKCQFNIGSNGTHCVLDIPDHWANSVVYVTVEFPIELHVCDHLNTWRGDFPIKRLLAPRGDAAEVTDGLMQFGDERSALMTHARSDAFRHLNIRGACIKLTFATYPIFDKYKR